ncbi:hypothetical protein DP939_14975 [Spongiactinospora rosea]|uniref:Tetratricopeptide repeat protein n=1 Tax=Spongiactinospora rosea TaxID=2248750 RepID=A0A366LZ40_9ACTN|nr:hypothetical protein [Spongiactinospora rosea]RBQ19238.1 hypothetical protein DP939_14975 [Spongiactinospora rosea]
MSGGADEVHELIERAGGTPYGQAKTVLLERALGLAESLRDRDLTLRVRMDLTAAYQHGAEPAKSFATFTRCLAEYDAEPGRFGEWETHYLLWQFKWITSSMIRFPEVPLRRAQDALTEMESRYQKAGAGLHAVYAQRCYLAQHLGDQEAADEWFHRWRTTPRDQLSDCEGCDPSGQVWHLAWLGRDEEAVELAAPVVAGELTCHVQPQGILTRLLVPYLRTGRMPEAAAAHRRAYRIVAGDANYVDDFGDHIEFCALTGNEARGLEILQRESPLLDRAASPRAAMRFASAAGLLLRRLEEIGHGDTVIRRPGEETTASALRPRMEAAARELAARFDARNGTDEQSLRVEQTMASEPLVEHLPLTPHARRVLPSAPVPPTLPEPAETTPDALLDLAERAWDEADFRAAVMTWARFDELYAEAADPGLSEVQRARRGEGRGLTAAQDRPRETIDEWERAALGYARAGEELRRQATLGRLALMRVTLGDEGDWIAAAEESAAYLDAHGIPAQRTAAAVRLAQTYHEAGRPDDAVRLLESTAERCEEPGRPLLRLAEILAQDPAALDTAAAAAARARAVLRPAGGMRLASASLLHARLLREQAAALPTPPAQATGQDGPLEAVAEAYDEALSAAPRADSGLRAFVYAGRGEALLALGRAVEAADDLIEAVASLTAIGANEQAAVVRVDLCRAYMATGRPLDAAEAAEEALAMLPEQLADERLTARWVRADAQRDLAEAGDPETVLADYREVEAGLLARDRRADAVSVAEAAGDLLMRLSRHEEAAGVYARAAGLGDGDPLRAARLLRLHGTAVYKLDREEEAMEIFAAARDALAGLPADDPDAVWETSRIGCAEAEALDWLGVPDLARERCKEAIAGFRSIGAHEAADRAAEILASIYRDPGDDDDDGGPEVAR